MPFMEFYPRTTLYQYCSADAFHGILQSKTLWYTDLAGANDPREIHLGYEHVLEAIKSVSNESKGSLRRALGKLSEGLSRARQDQQAFCCCFSLAKDELPMWGAYGGNHSGLAIGFRPTAILSMPGRLQRVTYLDESTGEGFRDLVRTMATEIDPDVEDEIYWINATASVFAAVTALKHNTWNYEREVRLVYMQVKDAPEGEAASIPMDYFDDGTELFWRKPLERRGISGGVCYVAFPFGRRLNDSVEHNGAIERVILGSDCKLTRDEVDAALKSHGFVRYEIIDSNCRIRVA
ncbi:DUF2971 domain-containing protein [Bradyrhizobium centrolobii]|uniref:DUF2971 domain-containing protein n=1 Tax=Bradyrhizobium centrolobii TaxID=1505087 RepID=UPI0009ED62F5|nr:DUF2971 domain-containing protein [Bradyrhizobium centrolobii]